MAWRIMKQQFKTAGTVAGVVAFLALASYVTTSKQWDGGFPSGEFRVNLRDPDGKPIQGAILRVYRGGTRDLAFDYPLDNHVPGQDLITDEEGRLAAIRTNDWLQFGGHAWRLFWLIPLGAKAPQYDCEITRVGFKPRTFRIGRLFESPHRYHKDFPKTKRIANGKEIELPIYEHTFTLER
jgi:hypothetical protein